jgi:hypothetical protein
MSSAGSSSSEAAAFLASSLKGGYAATHRLDVWTSHDEMSSSVDEMKGGRAC